MVYSIINKLIVWRQRQKFNHYIKSLPDKIQKMRKKPTIKVGFILHEVALWKTEELYNAMHAHPKFCPQLYTALSGEGQPLSISKKYIQLIDCLNSKGYEYVEARTFDNIDADIIFYEKPYDESYLTRIQSRYCDALIAYVPYGFNSFKLEGTYNLDCILRSFQFYIENESVNHALKKIMVNKGNNTLVTGLPMMDTLLKPKECFANPWKMQRKLKKRIIWAPHFSIQQGVSWLDLSSFMMMYDIMPKLAKKYENEIQIAFKPHPILFNKLVNLWGLKKTKKYYGQWDEMGNCQLETGEYVGLFKHSDAMIHDCGSFLIEYLYTGKPVMYTLRDIPKTTELLNEFGRTAFDCLYHGSTIEDIENFILDVIRGEDKKKQMRHDFKSQNLLPPNNKTACDNIIDAILGR